MLTYRGASSEGF